MNTILITKDGNQICALLGDNLMEGYAGFGNNVVEALRELAKTLEEEGVADEIESSL